VPCGILLTQSNVVSRDNPVGIATGYGLDGIGVGVRVSLLQMIFVSPQRPDRLQGSPRLLTSGVNQPEGDADNSTPSTAEIPPLLNTSSRRSV
jgi:hypothetical protein